MTADDLADLFDQYGLVLGAKIERWHDRPGGAQGMVDLAPDTSVDKAIEALHGSMVGTHKLAVRRAPKPTAKAKKPAAQRTSTPVSFAVAKEPMARPAGTPLTFPASAAPVRKVVVEYRTPRRIVLPPRIPRTGEAS